MNGDTSQAILDHAARELEKFRPQVENCSGFDQWVKQGFTAAEAASVEVVERRYIVEDIIREKSLSIFFGAPGDLKSALGMDMAMCIGSGDPWLQPLPVEGNKQRSFATLQGRVLWLNYDQSNDDVVERFGAMARAYGGGDNVKAISHSNPIATLSNESEARALGKSLKSEDFSAVFIDCLLDIKGQADLQDADMGEVLRMWRIVAEVGEVAVIIIAHSTKQSGDLYGSQFIKSRLDHLYHVTRPAGTDVAIIESKKQRSFGEDGKISARWIYQHFDGTRTLKHARFWGDSTENKAAHPNNTTQTAVLRILMESPGRGFSAANLTDILNDSREGDDLLKSNAVRNAANHVNKTDSKVGKTEVDGLNLYHYGELSQASTNGSHTHTTPL